MNKRKKRIRRNHKNFKKSNFDLLKKILRILSWLLPGLVIKRWMFTSAIGFLTTLLGVIIWTNLRPLYWLIEIFFSVITGLTTILPVSLMGPLIFVIGILLIGIGQNRSINSIQKALVPEKDTFLVDALRVKSKLNRGPNIVAIGGGAKTEDGKTIPMDVKVGDKVLFGKWSGTEVKIDGKEYSIMKESDIMGISSK